MAFCFLLSSCPLVEPTRISCRALSTLQELCSPHPAHPKSCIANSQSLHPVAEQTARLAVCWIVDSDGVSGPVMSWRTITYCTVHWTPASQSRRVGPWHGSFPAVPPHHILAICVPLLCSHFLRPLFPRSASKFKSHCYNA